MSATLDLACSLDRDAFSSARATAGQDLAPVTRPHTYAEAVHASAAALFRLIGSFCAHTSAGSLDETAAFGKRLRLPAQLSIQTVVPSKFAQRVVFERVIERVHAQVNLLGTTVCIYSFIHFSSTCLTTHCVLEIINKKKISNQLFSKLNRARYEFPGYLASRTG